MTHQYNFPVLYFETTRRCNLTCCVCMSGSNGTKTEVQRRHSELSFDECVDLVLRPAKALGASNVGFSGGEFLLREDSIQLTEAAAALGYGIRIITNGVLLTEQLLRRLQQAARGKLVMVFGLNSILDNELNQHSRNVDLEVPMRGLELCARLGIKRHVVVTIGNFNADDLDATFDWLTQRQIPFNRAPFVPRNSGRRWFADYAFSRKSMEQSIHPALRKHFNGYISYTPFFLSPEVHSEVSGGLSKNVTVPQNPSIGCWCGTWLAVGAEGGVSPCAVLLDELEAGSVREKPLYDIIDQSPIFKDILDRNRLKGRCGRCRYKLTCGGCRAMAWYHSGDHMAEDPTCFFEPFDESTVCPHEAETNQKFRLYARLAILAGIKDYG